MVDQSIIADRARERLLYRNDVSRPFFDAEAIRIAAICRRMAERFLDGGRLLTFGRGACATDAQHVSVEFVHPVIVGKRALPALDLSPFIDGGYETIERMEDIVMGIGPPGADPVIEALLDRAHRAGALTLALPGRVGDYAVVSPTDDPFIHQEAIEVLYHTLWESVHVFFEHRGDGHDVGESDFLYPFLGSVQQETGRLVEDVASSIVQKAREVDGLRRTIAQDHAELLAEIALAMYKRLSFGGKIITMGNGGSATDANDFALDCAAPPRGMRPVQAISLSAEPAVLTAIANDIGAEAIFLRQVIAHAASKDVVFAISTSGSSANVVAALEQAGKIGSLRIALLGNDGGDIVRNGLADLAVVVPCDYIPRIQEVHGSIYHVLRELIEAIRRNP